MDELKTLAEIGIPSACIVMLFIVLKFKKEFPTPSKIALWIAIGFVTILAAMQLIFLFSGKDISLEINPKSIYAFTPDGTPTDLIIKIIKNQKEFGDPRVINKVDDKQYASRAISLELLAGEENKFSVKYQGNRIGQLNFDQIRNVGWKPSFECKPVSSEINFWSTYKVHEGQIAFLGDTSNGRLSIKIDQINDTAKVTLILEGQHGPNPETVKLENGKIASQDFLNLPTFYIGMREADWSSVDKEQRWCAFTVFTVEK